MHFEQLYLSCLSQASFLIGDAGQCAIVDPRRDVDVYLEAAARLGLTIKHVIETHLHADFVSGHIELAERTGATIHVGHRAGATYPHQAVHDGDELRLGEVLLRFLETPGHTPESLCVLVFDLAVSATAPAKVLTGDTLFIGDVGRPDLVSSKGFSAEQMAGFLYDSVHQKLLTLPDETEVWPGHGAGSACGRSLSTELSSTIGEQRRTNLALAPMAREAFIAMQTAGLAPAPRYFPRSAELNRQGAAALDARPAPPALDPAAVEAACADGALVLDLRPADAFAAGHVPGSVNIGLDGSFASWVGGLIDGDVPLVLLSDRDDAIGEAVVRLARVGHDALAGHLAGGTRAWLDSGRALASHPRLDAAALAERLAGARPPCVIDVRQPGEHGGGHVPGALNLPVRELTERLDELPRDRPLAVICQTGYRSSAATSLLARAGFHDLLDVAGGTAGWIAAGRPVEESPAVCG